VRPVIWNKLLINVGVNAITALTGLKNGQILDIEPTRDLVKAAVEEALAVARALEIEVLDRAVEHVFEVARATAGNRSSMGQDVDHRRPTEIEAINGAIVDKARALGLEVPVNQTLTGLIKTLEAHY
ncbi:MAG: 2-dehydropantoate 2-reductase, partial [Deltaproteobacteria bacterium]|nr:2-dehydropantoate 2-reductase [Deltaproteobacteria bacterium]